MVMFDLMALGLVKLLKLHIEQKQSRAFYYDAGRKSCVVIEVVGEALSADRAAVLYAWGVTEAMWATKIRAEAAAAAFSENPGQVPRQYCPY